MRAVAGTEVEGLPLTAYSMGAKQKNGKPRKKHQAKEEARAACVT